MTNAYDLIDRELARLHELIKLAVTLPKPVQRYTSDGFNTPPMPEDVIEAAWTKIELLQKVIIESYAQSDKNLQEKLAELALLNK